MIRKFFFLLIPLLVWSSRLPAQGRLILTSGKIISYMKFESRPGYLDVWDSFTWEKRSIPIDSIVGYFKFEEDDDLLYYKIPDNTGNADINYQFLPPGLRGAINTYGYTVTFRQGRTYEPLEYLFVQKGERFDILFPLINGATLDTSLAIFKSYLADRPELLQEVDRTNYRPELAKELIARYNLLTYTPPAETTSQGEVTFYRMKTGELNEPVTLTVLESDYPFGRYVMRNLTLPAGQALKVCLSAADRQECLLLEPVPYFRTYYRVSYKRKKGLTLQRVARKTAFDELLELKKFKK